uniref:J domain-containing protein n=1 Tax=Plectus sambesii TaxID=2011161 RepID=A0A914X6K2_9BILA
MSIAFKYLLKSNIPVSYCDNSRQRDYYEVLNVDRFASQREIRNAYIAQSKKLHPDRLAQTQPPLIADQTSHERFIELQQAYDTLRNSQSRRDYDFDQGYPRHTTAKYHQPHDYSADSSDRYSSQFYSGTDPMGGYRSSHSRMRTGSFGGFQNLKSVKQVRWNLRRVVLTAVLRFALILFIIGSILHQ